MRVDGDSSEDEAEAKGALTVRLEMIIAFFQCFHYVRLHVHNSIIVVVLLFLIILHVFYYGNKTI